MKAFKAEEERSGSYMTTKLPYPAVWDKLRRGGVRNKGFPLIYCLVIKPHHVSLVLKKASEEGIDADGQPERRLEIDSELNSTSRRSRNEHRYIIITFIP